MVNGTWFYGTYMLDNQNENIGGNNVGPNPGPNCGNWCVQGPLVSFRHSTDKGETWDDPKMNATDGRDNLFHETAVGKRHFLRHLYFKTNILPRQSRDKHRDTLKNRAAFP
jgi:hypothetical protein